jgi:hypothetical protein
MAQFSSYPSSKFSTLLSPSITPTPYHTGYVCICTQNLLLTSSSTSVVSFHLFPPHNGSKCATFNAQRDQTTATIYLSVRCEELSRCPNRIDGSHTVGSTCTPAVLRLFSNTASILQIPLYHSPKVHRTHPSHWRKRQ